MKEKTGKPLDSLRNTCQENLFALLLTPCSIRENRNNSFRTTRAAVPKLRGASF